MTCTAPCKHNTPGKGCTLFPGRSWLHCRRAAPAPNPKPAPTKKERK